MPDKNHKNSAPQSNILIVCTSPALGGLELYAQREWNTLTQNNQNNCHFAVSATGELARRVGDSQKKKILHLESRKIFPLLTARKMARYIDENSIDLIHMHWNNDLHLGVLAKILSKKRPALIYSRHMRITRPKTDLLHRFLYRQVDLLLAVSNCVKEDAHQFLPLRNTQIQLLHPGVAAPATTITSCQAGLPGQISGNRFNIGMFGRIEQNKGQHLLINAVAALLSMGIQVTAYIIGHAMEPRYLQQLKNRVASDGLSSHIFFMDFVENPSQILHCFDVITLLTRCETFGLILAEAMRANTAVIGTNAGGVPDIIDHEKNGLLIEPENTEMLINAIKRLNASPELKKTLACAGKEKADRLFNEELHFLKLGDIIMEHSNPSRI